MLLQVSVIIWSLKVQIKSTNTVKNILQFMIVILATFLILVTAKTSNMTCYILLYTIL